VAKSLIVTKLSSAIVTVLGPAKHKFLAVSKPTYLNYK